MLGKKSKNLTEEFLNIVFFYLLIKKRGEQMAKAKTPKQLEIKIKSLKKQITTLEKKKKVADVKAVKKKTVKKATTKKAVNKKRR